MILFHCLPAQSCALEVCVKARGEQESSFYNKLNLPTFFSHYCVDQRVYLKVTCFTSSAFFVFLFFGGSR